MSRFGELLRSLNTLKRLAIAEPADRKVDGLRSQGLLGED